MTQDEILQELSEVCEKGNANRTAELTQAALDEGVEPQAVLDDALIKAMGRVGDRFSEGKAFVPEMLIAARAMNKALEILEPRLAASGVAPRGVIVIGTIQGDLHDIGKNLVGIMFKGAGFRVIDLGVDVSPEAFVDSAKGNDADFIGVSALLTTTMVTMQDVADALKESGLHTRLLVGGAPLNDDFAAKIGSSGYAPDAKKAVELATSLLA